MTSTDTLGRLHRICTRRRSLTGWLWRVCISIVPASPLLWRGIKLCRMAMYWWSRGDLNPRPRQCECRALPTELRPHESFVYCMTIGYIGLASHSSSRNIPKFLRQSKCHRFLNTRLFYSFGCSIILEFLYNLFDQSFGC